MPVSISNDNKGATGISNKKASSSFFVSKNINKEPLLKAGVKTLLRLPMLSRIAAFSPESLFFYLSENAIGRETAQEQMSLLKQMFKGDSVADAKSFLSLASSLAFAEKNIVLNEKTLLDFLPYLFGPVQERTESGETFLHLFNHTKKRGGLEWKVFPFSVDSNFSAFGGSVTVGMQNNLCSKLNINWMSQNSPHTIHMDCIKKEFYCCGESFVEPSRRAFMAQVGVILGGIGFKRSTSQFELAQFDGFYLYKIPEEMDYKA